MFFLSLTNSLEILRIASPSIPLSVNNTTADIPGAPIATLRITVDKINPVFLARFAKSTVNLYDNSKIRKSTIGIENFLAMRLMIEYDPEF